MTIIFADVRKLIIFPGFPSWTIMAARAQITRRPRGPRTLSKFHRTTPSSFDFALVLCVWLLNGTVAAATVPYDSLPPDARKTKSRNNEADVFLLFSSYLYLSGLLLLLYPRQRWVLTSITRTFRSRMREIMASTWKRYADTTFEIFPMLETFWIKLQSKNAPINGHYWKPIWQIAAGDNC